MSGQDLRRHTALRALVAVARHHGVDLTVERIVHDYGIDTDDEVPPRLMLRIAREAGFRARGLGLSWEDLFEVEEAYPFIARLNNGNHVVFSGVRGDPESGGEVAIFDPLAERTDFIFVDRDRLGNLWDGDVILLKRRHAATDRDRPFGLAWFVAEVLRESSLFSKVALAALFLHLIGLVTPIYFQIVIDKVLVHESVATLVALGIGVTVALFFEAILGFLRQLLLLYATNRIDVRLAHRTFDHLMRLPLHFFETSSAGVVTKHMQQAEEIRDFLTGRLFLTALDATSLLIFVPVLFFYSVKLSLLVLLFSALIAAVVLLVMPIFRDRLQRLYRADGKRQSMLVETIHGMRTVKALTIEPMQRRRWDEATAETVLTQFQVRRLSGAASAVVGLLEKLLTVALVWYGALLVFDRELTIGALVAVNMLAGRVSGPLVQIVSLVNEYQQTALSVRMLAQIMNRQPERDSSAGALAPRLRGEIAFEGVTFYYPGSAMPALDGVTLRIPAGSVVGVVGRSGSGKTTFTRLLQGLYVPQQGHIRFDGHELRELDLANLRRSVGIVVQESFLFRGTVRENIAITMPDASFAEVVAAARASGADSFIQRLPQGYDTPLEENASNLSGGEKQRLSIARSLLPQPPVLIFDEATSALDPESEAIVQANLAEISRGRTLVIVSHRLASIADADFILVFDRGKVADIGTHRELLDRSPVYRHLWDQQMGALERAASAAALPPAAKRAGAGGGGA
ncbi:MAG TPA: peptidase domain-containing ABC transporter [Geminicoccaceae bacterium]|nr:peptidase domain-containing ABC transporter [Geminicoccaceae bacterium]